MNLWLKRVSENESQQMRCDDCPGPDWHELERDPLPSETVEIVDEKAVIVAAVVVAPPDPRRVAVLSALPDILLAVADGKDLKSEIEKVLSAMPVEEVGNDRSSG